MNLSSVFISKRLEEVFLLADFCKQNKIDLVAESLIEFEALALEKIFPQAEIYFFGSKNAFDFFQKLNLSLENKQIAVIGSSTKKHIENLGFRVDFYGEEAGNPQQVAQDLIKWLGKEKISFFQSDISKRNIARFIPETQKEEYVIYKTKSLSQKLNKRFDLYIFTSPSNVKSFLEQNTIPQSAKVISWGKSTDEALSEKGISIFYSLKKASLEELVGFIGDQT